MTLCAVGRAPREERRAVSRTPSSALLPVVVVARLALVARALRPPRWSLGPSVRRSFACRVWISSLRRLASRASRGAHDAEARRALEEELADVAGAAATLEGELEEASDNAWAGCF